MPKLEYPIIENFSPEITVEVMGLTEPTKVVAIVDTGFTGFLQIPLAIGLRSNLRLLSVGNSVLADGRKVKNLQCFGTIRFAGKEIFGVMSLSETSNDSLLGMQFLEKVGMDFTLSISDRKSTFIDREPIPTVKQNKSPKTKQKTKKE